MHSFAAVFTSLRSKYAGEKPFSWAKPASYYYFSPLSWGHVSMCSAHPLFNPNWVRSNDGQRVSTFFISLFFSTPIWQKKLTAGSCRCRELMPIGDRVRIFLHSYKDNKLLREVKEITICEFGGNLQIRSEGWVVHTSSVGQFLGSTRNPWFWFLNSFKGWVWVFFFSFLMYWNLIF